MSKLGNHLDFQSYEARNMVLHNVSVLPTNPKKGHIYFLTTTNKAFYYDGTAWLLVGSEIKKHTQLIGDGTLTDIVVTHNLGSKNIVVSVVEEATGEAILVTWKATSANEITLTFGDAPTQDQYAVTVIG